MADPSIAGSGVLTRFLAFVVLFVACGITVAYAALNDRIGTLSIDIWRYIVLAMGTGMLYAVAGGYELLAADAVAATTVTGIRQVLQLCFIILLSLSMRELHYRLPYRDPESTPISHGRARFLEAVFIESTRRKPTALALSLTHKLTESQTDVSDAVEANLQSEDRGEE